MSDSKHGDTEALKQPLQDDDQEEQAGISGYKPSFLKEVFKQLLGEFAGTFILVLMGCSSNVQGSLSVGIGPLAWAIGIFFGVLCTAKISGGHLNPAVTIAMAWHGKFDWSRVVFYCVGQGLGAFCASLLVFVTYKKELLEVAGGVLLVPPLAGATAGNFGTYPNNHANAVNGFVAESQPSIMQCLFDQIMGTAFLLFVICAVTDPLGPMKKNPAVNAPFCVAMAIYAIGSAFGFNCGYAVNPARDFGPRFMTSIMGYGPQVFNAFGNFCWVPVAGPCIGAIFGAEFYFSTIGAHNVETDNYLKAVEQQQKAQELAQVEKKN